MYSRKAQIDPDVQHGANAVLQWMLDQSIEPLHAAILAYRPKLQAQIPSNTSEWRGWPWEQRNDFERLGEIDKWLGKYEKYKATPLVPDGHFEKRSGKYLQFVTEATWLLRTERREGRDAPTDLLGNVGPRFLAKIVHYSSMNPKSNGVRLFFTASWEDIRAALSPTGAEVSSISNSPLAAASR
jgi:hypothetical protein